jgi:pimeloyl-ACP methyl ester carboxylesterase
VTPPLAHDVEHFAVSADGRYLAYTWSEGGFSRLALTDQRNHLDLKPPAGLPFGVINALRFERSGTRLALEIESSTAPPDVFVADAATAAWTRWTESEPAVPGAASPVPALRLRFPTWDRSGGGTREQGGFVYLPSRPGRLPVLVLLHDGPAGRFRPGFDAWLQFLVNELGVAVVTPNLRGSGPGARAFASPDDGTQREDAIRDIGSLLVWIGVQPRLDASRVALMGRGYGGYQALAALAQYGDRLRAAVAIDPLADPAAADAAGAKSNPPPLGSSSDAPQRALLQHPSALGFAGSILRPVLLASLDGIPESGLSSAEQILWRMRANHRDAAYLAVDPRRCDADCAPVRAAAWAAIGAYLQDALSMDAAGTGP